jgi:ElaB/YqjD/DUF883 family membrane-anchored ribosome-binding protein
MKNQTAMKQTVDQFNQAQSRMAGDIKAVIADGEDLLKATAEVSGAGFAVTRAKFEEKFRSASASLADASRAAVGTARKTAAATDNYVHESPWTAIGVAAAAGLVIGFLATRR